MSAAMLLAIACLCVILVGLAILIYLGVQALVKIHEMLLHLRLTVDEIKPNIAAVVDAIDRSTENYAHWNRP